MTGSNLAACQAGIIPETIPMMLEIIIPKIILPEVRIISNDPRGKKLTKKTRNIPKIPPRMHKNTDSKRN